MLVKVRQAKIDGPTAEDVAVAADVSVGGEPAQVPVALEPGETVLIQTWCINRLTGKEGALYFTNMRCIAGGGPSESSSVDFEAPLSGIAKIEEDGLKFVYHIESRGTFIDALPSENEEEHEIKKCAFHVVAIGHANQGWLSRGECIVMADACAKPDYGAILLTNMRFVFIKLGFSKHMKVAMGSADVLDYFESGRELELEIPISQIKEITASLFRGIAIVHTLQGQAYHADSVKFAALKDVLSNHIAMDLIDGGKCILSEDTVSFQ
jgi:hypothetical protein